MTRVLFLGDPQNPLALWLKEQESDFSATQDKVEAQTMRQFDVAVSYGYRHILRAGTFDAPRQGTVNLHISYLPWNRGADPNIWSFVEGTPKGVTVHFIDAGVDTGDIIAQRLVKPGPSDTLRTFYDTLQREIQDLFKEVWPSIKGGTCPRKKQSGAGSFHLKKDFERLSTLLAAKGWDTPLTALTRFEEEAHGA